MPWFHPKCPNCSFEFNLDYNYLEKDFKKPNIPGVRFYTSHVFSVNALPVARGTGITPQTMI